MRHLRSSFFFLNIGLVVFRVRFEKQVSKSIQCNGLESPFEIDWYKGCVVLVMGLFEESSVVRHGSVPLSLSKNVISCKRALYAVRKSS